MIHVDPKGFQEYTIDKHGNPKYLIEQLQYDLNSKSRANKEKQ